MVKPFTRRIDPVAYCATHHQYRPCGYCNDLYSKAVSQRAKQLHILNKKHQAEYIATLKAKDQQPCD